MATSDLEEQDPLAALGNLLNQDEDAGDDPSAMSLVDHLEELRWRIFKALIAVVVGSIIAFIFRVQVVDFLEAPLPRVVNSLQKFGVNGQLAVTGLTDGFTVFLMVSLAAGIVLALPVILYQAWAFIAPGLYDHEKKHAVPFIFIGILLFAMGISLGYVVLRYPVQWLIAFASTNFLVLPTADSYFTFVAFFVLAFGMVFELPLVLTFLAKVGIVSRETLIRKRATAHIGMWIAATFLTPGADIYSPIFLGVAMSFLYELTIIFIRIFVKNEEAA